MAHRVRHHDIEIGRVQANDVRETVHGVDRYECENRSERGRAAVEVVRKSFPMLENSNAKATLAKVPHAYFAISLSLAFWNAAKTTNPEP